VWGHLRGTVHAGAQGDESSVVCAMDLSPMQLRIGSLAATSPPRKGKTQPEIASVRDGRLVAEPWSPKEKPKAADGGIKGEDIQG
jgi:septum site-determining protein MinC